MRVKPILRALLSTAFTISVLFTVSVKEVHYLFATHEANHEHCDNHLHSADEHGHCEICKFDISTFTDGITAAINFSAQEVYTSFRSSYKTITAISCAVSPCLRGPPAFTC